MAKLHAQSLHTLYYELEGFPCVTICWPLKVPYSSFLAIHPEDNVFVIQNLLEKPPCKVGGTQRYSVGQYLSMYVLLWTQNMTFDPCPYKDLCIRDSIVYYSALEAMQRPIQCTLTLCTSLSVAFCADGHLCGTWQTPLVVREICLTLVVSVVWQMWHCVEVSIHKDVGSYIPVRSWFFTWFSQITAKTLVLAWLLQEKTWSDPSLKVLSVGADVHNAC